MDAADIATVLILIVGFAATIAVSFRAVLWRKLKTQGARSWPVSQGKIEFGTVIQQRTRYCTYDLAQMAYSYAVNGEYYSGYYEKMFFREGSAQKFADDLKGKPAFVRHKATSAEVSTLLREDQQSVWPMQK
jgi:hypothetical protein